MSFLNVFGRADAGSDALPATLTRSGANLDTAFEVFIEGALTKIYNEAHGRTKDQRAVRESCKSVLGATPWPGSASPWCSQGSAGPALWSARS